MFGNAKLILGRVSRHHCGRLYFQQSWCRAGVDFTFLCYELTYSVVYNANILLSEVLHKMLLIHHHPWLRKFLHPPPGRFQGSWTREVQHVLISLWILKDFSFQLQIGPWKLTQNIIQQEGVLGLFRGLGSTIAREMPGYFFFFGGYEATRGLLTPAGKTKDEIGTELCISECIFFFF